VKQYDFLIAGGGAAGLSLAYRLAHSPFRDCAILVVDRSRQAGQDRTWAFWTKSPPGTPLACRTWRRLRIAIPGKEQILDLGPYQYQVIRGADFYRCIRSTLSRLPNVEFRQGHVDRIIDSPTGALVCVDGQEVASRWVFDSRFRLADFHPDPQRYHYLKMQFRGWEIETPVPCFDPQIPTFLDFRTPQAGQMRFFYVLPYTAQRALVEYVVCADQPVRRAAQEQALHVYIREVLGIAQYRVVSQEQGINPMTDYPFPRRAGRHIMRIGIPAGMLKPTTGFAFTRIQRDAAAIVRSLVDHGHPFQVPAAAWGYRLYDSLLLGTMARQGRHMGMLLTTLFRLGSPERILRFLDERGAPL
jgi:lycopene beta-cyclase